MTTACPAGWITEAATSSPRPSSWCPCVSRMLRCPLILSRRRERPRSYDVDASFMLLLQRERGIHALLLGTGDAKVTDVRFSAHAAPADAMNPRPAATAPRRDSTPP